MTTMPSREQYPDFRKYLEAFDSWTKTKEGMAYAAEEARKKAEREAEEQQVFESNIIPAQTRLLTKIGVPTRALEAARGPLEETIAIHASSGSSEFLVLSGGPGCGKTVAAVCWLLEYVADPKKWQKDANDKRVPVFTGTRPIWVTAAKLARCDRYDEEAMTRLLRNPRLVIDDLGGEYLDKGGFYASMLDEIVNERQAESKPTIMTTNLDAAGFTARYGQRIVDRLREGGRFVGCGDASLRHPHKDAA